MPERRESRQRAAQAFVGQMTWPRTISLAVIARRHGATCERTADSDGVLWTYVFDDDTSLSVRGKGKSHKVEVQLP